MKWLVFSRNRAYQLDAFISSASANGGIKKSDITVLHRYDKEYQASLDSLMSEHGDCNFLAEDKFREQVCDWVAQAGGLVSFATDDALFTRSVNHEVIETVMRENPTVLTFVLRLGLHLDYCYPTATKQTVPNGQVISGIFAWDSSVAQGDWGYLLSVDGHVFRSSELLEILKSVNFKNPNTLEANIQPVKGYVSSIAACFLQSCYMNVPLNTVQTTFNNRAGQVTADMLESKFREGLRHDPAGVVDFFNRSAHQEMEI
jgi:hypothetical protein